MKLRVASTLMTLAGILLMAAGSFAVPTPRPPSPVAAASKKLAEARAKLVKAKDDLEPIRRRLAVNFEVKPEWKAAKEALDQAKDGYDSAARRVKVALEKDPTYKEQVEKRATAQKIVDASAKKDIPSADDNAPRLTDDDINKAQQDRVDSVIAMKKLERESGENDAAFVAARQKHKEAQTAWDALQNQLEDAIKLDPAYPSIKTEIDKAEAAVKSAQAQYDAAVKSAGATHRSPVRR